MIVISTNSINSLIIIFFILVFPQISKAQNNTIEAIVINKSTSQPLSNCSISYKKKYVGTVSNSDGYYSLELYNDNLVDSVKFSFVGFQTIKLPISECLKIDTLEMYVNKEQINEVVTKAKKINPTRLILSAVKNYNSKKLQHSHSAVAHYREKAKKDGKYIMFMESIGNSVFLNYTNNEIPLTSYKFICDNSRFHNSHPVWQDYKFRWVNKSSTHTGSSCNVNLFRFMELNSLLNNSLVMDYDYHIIDNYNLSNQKVYIVNFSGKYALGNIHIIESSKQILKLNFRTTKYWSTAYHNRVIADIKMEFAYIDDQPFVSSIASSFKHKGLEYSNIFKVVQQRMKKIYFTECDYWDYNSLGVNPYVIYMPLKWKSFNIEVDHEYSKIEEDLVGENNSLEDYFIKNSNKWFLNDSSLKLFSMTQLERLKNGLN
jgi:hypothetical protein